jgi:hypothetical protein
MIDTVLVPAISCRMRQVERGWTPGCRGMALVAGHIREQPGMIGGVGMAGSAGGGKGGKDCIGVTFCACQRCMSTRQREFRLGMVECGRCPSLGGMAGAALIAKLASVGVILGMAAGATLRSGL